MATTSPGPTPSKVGSQATSSLEPMVGSTPTVPEAAQADRTHDAIAARRAGVPAVSG
jgi:hypothetical protein